MTRFVKTLSLSSLLLLGACGGRSHSTEECEQGPLDDLRSSEGERSDNPSTGEVSCPAGFAVCGPVEAPRCVDTAIDGEHCGSCDAVCSDEQSCRGGFCVTQTEMECSGCLFASEMCVEGECVPYCSEDRLQGPNFLMKGETEIARFGDLDGDGDMDAAIIEGDYFGTIGLHLQDDESPDWPERVTDEESGVFSAGQSDLALADLDGDGALDLVSPDTRKEGHGLSVRYGVGDGSFEPRQWVFESGVYERRVLVGDVTGNDHPDLVLHTGSGGSLIVLQNTGERTFTQLSAFETDQQPRELLDVTGDGELDIVSSGDEGIVVFAGDGAGAFAAELTLPSDSPSVAIEDLNDDGRPDYVAVESNWMTSLVRTFLSRSDGTYAETGVRSIDVSAQDALFWDVDQDGLSDLVLALGDQFGDSMVGVLRGSGNGGFGAAELYGAGASWAYGLEVLDFNLDGEEELMVIGGGVSSISRAGNGKLAAPRALPTSRDRLQALAVADVSRDGHPDWIAAARYGAVILLVGDGAGGMAERQIWAFDDWQSDAHGIWAEVDETTTSSTRVSVATGSTLHEYKLYHHSTHGTWNLQATTEWALPYGTKVVRRADVNGDGLLDLLTAGVNRDSWDLRYGTDDGGYEPALEFPLELARDLRVVDANGDERLDVVVARGSLGTSLPSTGVSVFLQGGDGSWSSSFVPTDTIPRTATAVDLDLDGKLELVVADGDAAAYWTPDAVGTEWGELELLADLKGDGVYPTVADLDGDGHDDLTLVMPGGYIPTPTLFQTFLAAEGGPIPQEPIASLTPASAIVAADTNGDEAIDLSLVGYTQSIVVHENQPLCD